ncbi:MAG: hypothetical protein EAY75_15010 [Bacteroidetes bacterium]|nr:MAG: hypothetical protein EAY75_15010 [Bacteroidota bacterium]
MEVLFALYAFTGLIAMFIYLLRFTLMVFMAPFVLIKSFAQKENRRTAILAACAIAMWGLAVYLWAGL